MTCRAYYTDGFNNYYWESIIVDFEEDLQGKWAQIHRFGEDGHSRWRVPLDCLRLTIQPELLPQGLFLRILAMGGNLFLPSRPPISMNWNPPPLNVEQPQVQPQNAVKAVDSATVVNQCDVPAENISVDFANDFPNTEHPTLPPNSPLDDNKENDEPPNVPRRPITKSPAKNRSRSSNSRRVVVPPMATKEVLKSRADLRSESQKK